MHRAKRPVSTASITRRNEQNKGFIDEIEQRAFKLVNDPEKSDRLSKQLCKVCYYTSRMSGQACTSTNCGICDAEVRSGNTDVNVICSTCAKNHGLCVRCGCDIELKNRRNGWGL